MPTTQFSDRMALLEESATYALRVLAMISPADLDRPTPCDGWDVQTVVLHIADVSDAVIDFTATGALVMPAPRDRATPDPVAVARQRISALRQTVATAASGPESVDVLIQAAQGGANELAAHGWDLATACGSDLPIPDGVATTLLALISDALGEDARGDHFAPAIPVPPTATPGDRFVAFLGRSPVSRATRAGTR